MFLICCPNNQVPALVNGLATLGISSLGVPALDYAYNAASLEVLDGIINQFDFIIVPSGAVIDYAKIQIMNSIKPIFMTVGKSSAAKLQQLTQQKVIYPQLNSGGEALFEEQIRYLDLLDKKILVIKGEGGSEVLYSKMASCNIKWTTIDVYKRVFYDLEPDRLKKLLIIDGLQGIITTTSVLVEWLFKQARRANCVELLKNILFITLHPKIEQKLKDNGIKRVLVTPNADRTAVIELIRSLQCLR